MGENRGFVLFAFFLGEREIQEAAAAVVVGYCVFEELLFVGVGDFHETERVFVVRNQFWSVNGESEQAFAADFLGNFLHNRENEHVENEFAHSHFFYRWLVKFISFVNSKMRQLDCWNQKRIANVVIGERRRLQTEPGGKLPCF